MTKKPVKREKTDWSRYGTPCRTCGAQPYHACMRTRIAADAAPWEPKARPHKGRHVTKRKPYPREASVRAAQTRLHNWRKSGRLMIKVENWANRGYRPSDKRRRQINHKGVVVRSDHE